MSTNSTLTAIRGVRVGHWTDAVAATGCTAILFDRPAMAGVDVRGSAPGTRETDALAMTGAVQHIDAILLSGGSAFGLAAADGVMHWLEEAGRGFPTPAGPVPIVPAAVVYDLATGDAAIRPDAAAGYAAAAQASVDPVPQGNVGAGTGAVVGDRALGTKGGLGSAVIDHPAGLVAALAVVNPSGNVCDPQTGRRLAGTRDADGRVGPWGASGAPGQHTTLGVVVTSVRLDKTGVTKVAQMAQDGLARSIRPAHGQHDGDTVFAASTGTDSAAVDLTLVGHLGAEALAAAIVSGVRHATGAYGLPSAAELDVAAP